MILGMTVVEVVVELGLTVVVVLGYMEEGVVVINDVVSPLGLEFS